MYRKIHLYLLADLTPFLTLLIACLGEMKLDEFFHFG